MKKHILCRLGLHRYHTLIRKYYYAATLIEVDSEDEPYSDSRQISCVQKVCLRDECHKRVDTLTPFLEKRQRIHDSETRERQKAEQLWNERKGTKP